MSDFLTIWVIYYGASNHPPGKWVVRAQDVMPAGGRIISEHSRAEPGIRPHELFFECDSLEEARTKVPEGLYRMPRQFGDDPVIVECWL
jgi:hypothetical protein